MQAFGLIWLFPLTFLSSAFVPISTMPGWLQAFANNQPVTYVIDTMRALALGGPIAANLWKSMAWLAGIFIVFVPLAVRAYKRGDPPTDPPFGPGGSAVSSAAERRLPQWPRVGEHPGEERARGRKRAGVGHRVVGDAREWLPGPRGSA